MTYDVEVERRAVDGLREFERENLDSAILCFGPILRGGNDVNHNLRFEALDAVEVAHIADQALASLHARTGTNTLELVAAIDDTCEAWDRFADLLPEFREEAPCSGTSSTA